MLPDESQPQSPLVDYEKDREAWNLPLPSEILQPAWRESESPEELAGELADDPELEPAA